MTRIVILGGGFGGVRAALDLEKRLGKEAQITLIDRNSHHLFAPALYEVASAYGIPHDIFDQELRHTISIPYREIFEGKHVQFVQADVRAVDLYSQNVYTQGEHTFPYDYLVIALGAQTADFHIPGVRDYAYQFKTLDDAISLHNALYGLSERLRNQEDQSHLPYRIIIGGAGFTGVELAAELALYAKRVQRMHRLRKRPYLIYCLEAGPKILPMIRDEERHTILQRLTKLGVVIMEQSAIEEVRADIVKLKTSQTLKADVVVWTAGIQANQFLASIPGSPLSVSGKLVVGEHLHLSNFKNVFGVGDNIEFMDHATQKPIPSLGYLAVDHGRIVAQNILHSLQNKELVIHKPFYDLWVAPIGGKYAVAHLWWGISLKGFLAWMIREAIDFRYLARILSFKKALRLFARSRLVFFKND